VTTVSVLLATMIEDSNTTSASPALASTPALLITTKLQDNSFAISAILPACTATAVSPTVLSATPHQIMSPRITTPSLASTPAPTGSTLTSLIIFANYAI
jgi:hypothetical protein